eukprot:m.65289 g.65289  ORF g.65289 m.65289 type:complete len:1674 (+) comp23540_c1_seq1:81-5102(+)
MPRTKSSYEFPTNPQKRRLDSSASVSKRSKTKAQDDPYTFPDETLPPPEESSPPSPPGNTNDVQDEHRDGESDDSDVEFIALASSTSAPLTPLVAKADDTPTRRHDSLTSNRDKPPTASKRRRRDTTMVDKSPLPSSSSTSGDADLPPPQANTSLSKSIDEVNDDVAWSHLLQPNKEPFFEISREEQVFWEEYRTLCEDDSYTPLTEKLFEKLQGTKMSNYPLNLFAFREFIRKNGKNKTDAKYTNGMQRYECWNDKLKASNMRMDNAFGPLWEKMKPTQKDAKIQAKPGKTLRTHYKKFIAPFEQSLRFKPMETSLSPNTTPPSTSSQAQDQWQDHDSENIDDATLRDRIVLCQQLVSKLTVPPELLDMFQTQSRIILEALYERSKTKSASVKVLPIVGASRKGKSFFLNQILAMTEIPASSYNRSQQNFSLELSEDAARLATRVYMEDKDISPETYDQIFARISATAESLTIGKSVYSADKLPSVVWNIPRIFNPGVSRKNDSEDDFTDHCTINAKRHNHVSQKDVVSGFLEFMKVGASVPTPSVCEFLLPSRSTQKAVTSHNTYVWGGERYAMVVRFISDTQIKTWISSVQNETEKDTQYQKTVKKMLLHVLYTLEFGTQCGEGQAAINESIAKRNDMIKKWMNKKELPSWWSEKGRLVDVKTSTNTNIHCSARAQFGKIHIFQGAGKHAHDDRVYIRSKLANLMATTYTSLLIAEVHIIAPSWLVTPFNALVDTPGAGEADGSKFPRIRDAVNKANGFIVYVENTLGNEESTLNLLKDHGIYERIAAGWVAKPRDDHVLFVDSTERSSEIPRPLKCDDEESMIGEKWKAKLLEDSNDFESDLTETLVDKIEEALGTNDEPSTTEDVDADDRARIRREIAKPISNERHVSVFTSMHRAIIESMGLEPDDGVLSQNEPVTGVSKALSKIWEMLNKEISTKSLYDFSKLCGDVKEAAKPIPNCEVSLEIRKATEVILQGKLQHKYLRASIEEGINKEASAYVVSLDDETTTAFSWIDSTAKSLVKGYRSAITTISKKLTKKTASVVVRTTNLTDIRNCIDVILSADKKLFTSMKPNIISLEVFKTCKAVLSTETLWSSSLERHVKDSLEQVQKKFEEHCCSVINVPTDDAVARKHIKKVISTKFNINAKVNLAKAAFDTLTSNHDAKRNPTTYLSKRSMMHIVLEQFVDQVFKGGKYMKSGDTAEATKHDLERTLSNTNEEDMVSIMRQLLTDGMAYDIVLEKPGKAHKAVKKRSNIITSYLINMFLGSSGSKTRVLLKSIFKKVVDDDKAVDETAEKAPLALIEAANEIRILAKRREKCELNQETEVLKRTVRKVRLNAISTHIKHINVDFKKNRSWNEPKSEFKQINADTTDIDIDALLAPLTSAKIHVSKDVADRVSKLFPSLASNQYEAQYCGGSGMNTLFWTLCQTIRFNKDVKRADAAEALRELLTLKVEQAEHIFEEVHRNSSRTSDTNRTQSPSRDTNKSLQSGASNSTMIPYSKFLLQFSSHFNTDVDMYLVQDKEPNVLLQHNRNQSNIVRLVWDENSRALYLLREKKNKVDKKLRHDTANETRVYTPKPTELQDKREHYRQVEKQVPASRHNALRDGETKERPKDSSIRKKKVQDLNANMQIENIKQQIQKASSEGNFDLVVQLSQQLMKLKEHAGKQRAQ